MKNILMISFVLTLAACGNGEDNTTQPAQADTTATEPAEERSVAPDPRVESLQAMKSALDSMVLNQRIFVQTLVKQHAGTELVEVYGSDDWPEEETIQEIYNLNYRENGSTKFFSHKPHNLDDRRVQFTHYFDEENRTVAFEKYVMYYENSCVEGVLIETEIKYYDEQFNVIGSFYTMTDSEENTVKSDNCVPSLQDYAVFPTYEKLAESKGTKVLLGVES